MCTHDGPVNRGSRAPEHMYARVAWHPGMLLWHLGHSFKDGPLVSTFKCVGKSQTVKFEHEKRVAEQSAREEQTKRKSKQSVRQESSLQGEVCMESTVLCLGWLLLHKACFAL